MESTTSGTCPYCQMPLKLLHVQTFNLHLEVCFRRKKPKKECPKGLDCDSCMVSHYERFSHSLLAKKYSNNNTDVVLLASDSSVIESPTPAEDFDCSNFKQNKTASTNCSSKCRTRQKAIKTKSHFSDGDLKAKRNKANPTKNPKCPKAIVCLKSNDADSLTTDDSEKWPAVEQKGPGFAPHEPTISIVGDISLENLNSNISYPVNDSKQESFSFDVVSSAADFDKTEIDLPPQLVDNDDPDMMEFLGATSTQVSEMHDPSINVEATKSFTASPKSKKARLPDSFALKPFKALPKFSKSKQGDIGSMLFGMKPKETKKAVSSFSGSDSYENSVMSRPWRKCPFYKKIANSQIAVDAFNYGNIPGITTYFLSHFHYDHYMGLSKKWEQKIYCSEITGNLVESKLKLPSEQIIRLAMNKQTEINGHIVTLLEANHCPGAVLMLFQLKNGQTVLHSGDFRADKELCANPVLTGVHINTLHLDTTYLDPSYAFPPQNEVIEFTKNLVQEAIKEEPKTLFITGTYCIGKEKIFLGIAEVLDCKIFVTRDKMRTMSCLDNKKVNSLLTLSGIESNLHVLPMKNLNAKSLTQHLKKYSAKFVRILAIKPTGWTHDSGTNNLEDIKPSNSGNVKIYGMPYSEHSSFVELKEFVETHKPDRIIPTVNVGRPEARQKMEKYLNEWKKK